MSYASKDDFLDSFQGKYHEFVQSNSLPDKKEDKVLIKYFAILEKIVEKPTTRITSDKHYIWTKDHVKNYMTSNTAFIWVLRVYKLSKPYWAEHTPGAIRYANLADDVSLEDIEPVLNDLEFSNILKDL